MTATILSFRKQCFWSVLALALSFMIIGVGANQVWAVEPVGSISGKVTPDGGGTGIAGVRIDVYGTNWILANSVWTDSSGNYTAIVSAGSFYLASFNQRGYIDEYYSNVAKAGSPWPPAEVMPVHVIIGADTPTVNFQLGWGGSISGRVLKDLDGTALANVQIDVYDSNWNHLNSTLTESSGDYTVGGLPTGTYYVATLNQQGFSDEYYNNITKAGSAWPPTATGVSVTKGSQTLNINFRLASGGSISGVVKDSAETPIANVQIDVYDVNWNYLNATLTNVSGEYTVEGLPTGDYYVGTWNQQGYVDEYYSNINRLASSWPPAAATAVHATTGSITTGIDFRLAWGASISGRVVKDSNPSTGIQDVEVKLYDIDGGQVTSVLTDSSGNYSLGGLPEGNYYVRTSNNAGYLDEYYDNVSGPDAARLVSVAAGSNTPDINFGLAPSGSISGRVVNASSGTGIPGVVTTVYDGSWNLVGQDNTDSSGSYVVGGLPSGSYYVETWNYLGYVDQTYATPVPVTGGFNTPNINFALVMTGSISGRVMKENGAGIQSVTVYIYDPGWNYVTNARTDSSGIFRAGNLLAGSYYAATANDQGYLDEYYDNILVPGTPWPPAGATVIAVTGGADTANINFRLALGGSISGRVTHDLDGTGIRNTQIRVYDASWNSVKNDLTNILGDYTVRGLVPGNYYVMTSNDQGYINEYYDNKLTPGAATTVSVTAGSVTPNINFGLSSVTSAAPTVTGISPNSGVTGTIVNIPTLSGTGFATGVTVKLTRSGSPDINATSVGLISTTRISCAFNLAGAATGQWNVVVKNTDGQSGTLSNGFTVTNPAPIVTGIIPSSGASGTTVNITDLSGTGFLEGATVKLTKSGSGYINATSVMVVSSTRITCTLDLAGAATGQWNVVATNSDGQSGTRINGFTVTNSTAPTVTGITPNSGVTGTTVAITNLAGTGFLAGATVRLTRTGSADIGATSVVVASPTEIRCAFNLTGGALGPWNVVVTNTNAQSGILSDGFAVTTPTAPTVTGITPSSGVTGTTVTISNLAGTGFLDGAAVKLAKSGSADILATSVSVVSSTQITCTLNLTGAATGQWNVVVTNSDGESGTLSNGFTVTTQPPIETGVTVSSPDGGESWAAGTTQTISWTYAGNPGTYVKIELLKGGVLSTTIGMRPIGSGGTGSYAWLVPATQAGGGNYQIKVTSMTYAAYTDTSNGNFTITAPPPPAIAVVSPDGGESWAAGTTQTISWTYAGNPGTYVKIELLKGGVLNSTLGMRPIGSGGSGSYAWLIPATQAGGSDYQIKVTSMTYAACTDTSNVNFTIEGPPPPSIAVVSPDGGESWAAGTTQTISWTYAGNPGTYVKIELLKGGVLNTTIGTRPIGSGGTGSYAWLIPATQAGGSDYQIKVTSMTNGAYTDTSNADFTITAPPPPSIAVVSPDGGESWAAGTTQTISWTYAGNPGTYVKIELLKGGVLNTTIGTRPIGSGGTGSYAWLIPATQAGGSDYQIKVTSTTNPACTDTSNGNFTITGPPPPSIAVVSPDGGESWAAGTTQTISWTYAGNPGTYVKIELLKGGVLNTTIGMRPIGSGGSGSYAWLVPATQAAGSDYQIKVTSMTYPACTDTSNANFTITGPPPPSIAVVSPDGGESWAAGTTQTISWTYAGNPGTYVKIELLKGGVLNTTIGMRPIGSGGSGSYAWLVPATQAAGSDYQIKVTSMTNGAYTDTSNADFTITAPPPPSIAVVSPDGGESWAARTTQTISWTYAGNPGTYVKIELLKGGVLNTTIGMRPIGSGGSGSYAWLVPATQAAGSDYQIKVTSMTNGAYTDTSNADFTISGP